MKTKINKVWVIMETNKQIEVLNIICPLKIGYKNSKREIRINFFTNIQTEIQAYLLGFYVADGSLNLKRNTIRIKINEKDKEIIDLYQKFISPSARIRKNKSFTMIGTKNKPITVNPTYQIDISNKKISEDLSLLGFGERKTYKELSIPKLNNKLVWHFIRGYFDGDGCIMCSIRNPNKKNRERNFRATLRVQWTSKTKQLLSEVQIFLFKQSINSTISYRHDRDVYTLTICSKDSVNKFFKELYSNSNFYLKRKFSKFNYYVNTEVTQLIAEHCNA